LLFFSLLLFSFDDDDDNLNHHYHYIIKSKMNTAATTTTAANPNEAPPPSPPQQQPLEESMSSSSSKDSVDKDNMDDIHIHHHYDEHATLRRYPYVWAAVGVFQTFLTAIMFGWASLVPILRSEGLVDYTPTQLSQIFTAGAVGNYLATLPFGLVLDWYGPKTTGIVASVLYGLGLFLCGYNDRFWCFLFGFGLVGLARPGIQMPTLHLANLFGRGSGGAFYMSAQAAAFDAGTAVFALFHTFYFGYGISSRTMFWAYLVVPVWTLATAIWVWPNETIAKEEAPPAASPMLAESSSLSSPTIGSPYFSPKDRKALVASERRRLQQASQTVRMRSQVNAPLSVILTHVAFYALATWVSEERIHHMIITIEYTQCNVVVERYRLQMSFTIILLYSSHIHLHSTFFFVIPIVHTTTTTTTTTTTGRHSHLQIELHCRHHQRSTDASLRCRHGQSID
jgi:MFS family permease